MSGCQPLGIGCVAPSHSAQGVSAGRPGATLLAHIQQEITKIADTAQKKHKYSKAKPQVDKARVGGANFNCNGHILLILPYAQNTELLQNVKKKWYSVTGS